jgi:fatty-acyl-CoA synthase
VEKVEGNRRMRWHRVGSLAKDALFAGQVLHRTGLLSALSPSGVLSFARSARGVAPGPHVAMMLHAHNKPEKLALVDGTRRLSYGAIDREINRVAHALVARGVGGGDRVALMLPNCAEYVIVQQACARIGATAVQIGYRLKPAEIAYILDNAEPKVVFVHRDYAESMNEARRTAGGPDDGHVIVCRAQAAVPLAGARYADVVASIDDAEAERPPAPRAGELGGVIVYTSGTTGNPKGANRDFKQTGLEAVFDFMTQVGMSHDDRHLVVCPLYHSAAPAFVAMMFTLGASVVIMDQFEPEQVLETIARERITSAFMVPTQLVRLVNLPEAARRRHDVSSLRWICSGAAPLATTTAVRFQDEFGHMLWNFYGATETGLVTLAGPEDHGARPGTVGRLLRGNAARLLDDDGREVAPGEVGELYVRNSMLITGYHRNPEATAGSMRDGFFSVGDLARMDDDGYVYLESRKHDMVISGGVNIYPAEIENHLHTHPNIVEAAVIGVPDEEWGESLMAFVVKRPHAALSAEEVVAFCREALADYKRPRRVEFVDELPRNPTGKVLKRELRDRVA